MPRNSSGTMSGTNGPYTAGTTISSAAINARFADDEAETTDSLSRSGKGGMLAVLRGVDGTVAAPAYSFTSEVGTGAYRAAASDYRIALGGVDALQVTVSAVTLSANVRLNAAGAGISNIAAGSGLFVIGNVAATDATNPDVMLTSTATRTAGYLAAVQNAGTNKLRVDYQGLLSLASQAAPLQPASIWTAITPTAPWGTGRAIGYWKDVTGAVHVKGSAIWHTAAGVAMILPTGFRPADQRAFVVYNRMRAGFVELSVSAGGAITLDAGTVADGDEIYFDPINFLAEQ